MIDEYDETAFKFLMLLEDIENGEWPYSMSGEHADILQVFDDPAYVDWLDNQVARRDPVGDLARDALTSPVKTPRDMLYDLRRHNACNGAYVAFYVSALEFAHGAAEPVPGGVDGMFEDED